MGDICITERSAVFAVCEKLADYIIDSVDKIGRERVRLSRLTNPETFFYQKQTENISATVSSMRLDCIVCALTGFSRNKSAEYTKKGFVFINGEESKDVTRTIRVGDTVSVRGRGKYKISDNSSVTAKSRIKLLAIKYI